MAKFDPAKTPGEFGVPPADAPHEVTLPGSEVATVDQIRMARQNEQDLPSFNPKPMTDEQAASFLGKSVDQIRIMRANMGTVPQAPKTPSAPTPLPPLPTGTLLDSTGQPLTPATSLRRVHKPAPSVIETPVESLPDQPSMNEPPAQVAPEQATTGLAAAARSVHQQQLDPDQPYRPAASNTDSPSRGLPTAVADPGKKITGGFGDLGEAQYFPLDGVEAGKAAIRLLEALIARIKDDLRFSMAATYPRVSIRAVVEVECFAADHSFSIEKKMVPPHTKTPLDVARQYGDQIVFVLTESLVEMTPDGQSVAPPNAVRMELHLPVPRKRAVQTPGGRMLVDVTS